MTGQWAKKIRRRTFYFGVWSDPDDALQKYLAERDWLQAGVEPPEDTDSTVVADLCNHFLSAKKSRADCGELTLATFNDYKRCCERIVKTSGKMRPVDMIGPADFTRIRSAITSRYGPSRTSKEIVQVRMIFTWGHRLELSDAPRFGPEFVKPSRDVLRRHHQASPPRMFEADETRAMLDTATVRDG